MERHSFMGWSSKDEEYIFSFMNHLSPLQLSRSEYIPSGWQNEYLTGDTSLGYYGFGVGIDGEDYNIMNTAPCNTEDRSSIASSSKPSKAKMLSKETITQYFYMPISQASKETNFSVTVLKKRCRELVIIRWPYRKLNSIQNLEKNIQLGNKEGELELLEKERKLIEEVPDLQLEGKTKVRKRLRHAFFKAKSFSRSKTASA